VPGLLTDNAEFQLQRGQEEVMVFQTRPGSDLTRVNALVRGHVKQEVQKRHGLSRALTMRAEGGWFRPSV
jgi:hypothetical protein